MGHFPLWFWAYILAACENQLLTSASNDDHQEIVFGLIVGEKWSNGRARAGVENAVDQVNKKNFLSGYRLKLISLSADSEDECNEASILVNLLQQMSNSSGHQMVALIGAGCGSATESIAKISHYYNITLISCASLSEELSDHVRFPYYFQLLPSEVNLAHVFYSIIKEYGWRRVALIVQNEYRYRTMARHLKSLLSNNEGGTATDYIETFFDMEDGFTAISENVFDSRSRIFVVAMDSKFARQLICMAYRMGLKYPKHLFITYGSYESQWWAIQDDGIILGCSPKERADVLQFSLAALHYARLPEFENFFTESCSTMETASQLSHDSFSTYAGLQFYQHYFDATLALSIALNKTIENLTDPVLNNKAKEQAGIQTQRGFRITDFQYNVSIVANITKMYLEDSCFDGLSGPVRFDENGVRKVTELRVLQYRTNYINGTPINEVNGSAMLDHRLRLIDVAYIRGNNINLEFPENNTSDYLWPNVQPLDGVAVDDTTTVILPVAVILILFEIAGLLFAIFCLVFNIAYRNKKLIRLSSPNLNYLIITGTLLVYSSGLAFAVPLRSAPTVRAFCFIRTWLLTFGFTCGFAPIVAKMWRVYFIFRNPQATKKKNAIQDWQLLLFVFSLLVMNVGIMCLHVILEGIVANFNVELTPDKEIRSTIRGELKNPVNFFVYQCSSHLWIRFFIFAVIYGYMAILQFCALYFAFQTRKVKVKGLNDAKYIALIVYIVGILILINFVTTFALPTYVTIYATIYSSCLWVSATVVLGLSFIPKMVRLYKDPNGETVFTAHEEALQITTALGGPQPQLGELNNELNCLRKMIKELEDTIVEYKRITGVNLTKHNRLTTSLSMINLIAPNYTDIVEEKEKADRRGFKVSFELHPPVVEYYGDSNNCEIILENAPYSDSD